MAEQLREHASTKDQTSDSDLPGPRRALGIMFLPAVLLGVVITGYVVAGGGTVEEEALRTALPYLLALNHTLIFVALLGVLRSEGRSLADIGWRVRPGAGSWMREIAIGMLVALLVYLFKETVWDSARALLAGNRPTFTSLFRFRYPAGEIPMLFVGTTFIVVEELVYRGYGLAALERHWGRTAGLLSMGALFGLLHWGNGPLAILFTGVTGIGYGGLYLWRRTLLPLVVAHAGYNALVVLTP